MGLELTPQSTDVPGSSLSSSFPDGILCVLLAQQVLSFFKLGLNLVRHDGLLLQLTLQLCCPAHNMGSAVSSKEPQQQAAGGACNKAFMFV